MLRTILLSALPGLFLGVFAAAQPAAAPVPAQPPLPGKSWLSGGAEATAWAAWLAPSIQGGVIAYYNVRPALLTGTAVSVGIKGRTHFLFEYLTQVLEREIRGNLDPDDDNRILLNTAFRYRPSILQRLFGGHHLFTRMDVGRFEGSAVIFSPLRGGQRQQEPVSTSFFLADLLWMEESGPDDLFGGGVRITEYRLPAVVNGGPGAPALLKNTRQRTVTAAFAIRGHSPLSPRPDAKEFEGRFGLYVHEVLISAGIAEISNELVGNDLGIASTFDVDGGIRRDWKPWGESRLSAALGVRSNLIKSYSFSRVESRTWLIGPYLRIALAF